MDAGLKAVLEDANPWWRDSRAPAPPIQPYRRHAFLRVQRRLFGLEPNAGRAVLLHGLRRVGKTELALQIFAAQHQSVMLPPSSTGRGDEGARHRSQLAYINVDDARIRNSITVADVLEAWDPYRDPNRPAFLVLDEVHKLSDTSERRDRGWARQLKGLIDAKRITVLATGSAAVLLNEGASSAPGRWLLEHLEPLSFREFREMQPGSAAASNAIERATRFRDLERYLARGGFPAHARVENAVDAFEPVRLFTRQVLDLEIVRSRDTDRLEQLYRVLLELSGANINVDKLSRSLGVGRPTIESWLGQLEQAFLIQRVWRVGSNTLQQLRGQPKVYGTDPGLVAAFARTNDPLADSNVRAQIQEAAVLRHLREVAERIGARVDCLQRESKRGIKSMAIERECDFVLHTPDEAFLVEVASATNLSGKQRDVPSLAADMLAARRWKSVRAVVVHSGSAELQGDIRGVPLAMFLEEVLPAPEGDSLEALRGLSTVVKGGQR